MIQVWTSLAVACSDVFAVRPHTGDLHPAAAVAQQHNVGTDHLMLMLQSLQLHAGGCGRKAKHRHSG